MNFLYINHYAGTPALGMEYRPYYLAREWVRMGHRVTMLAASYSHVRTLQPRIYGREARQVIDGIDYRWFRTPRYRGNGIGRLRNILAFLRGVHTAGDRLIAQCKPDVVIASSTYPLDIWVARGIAHRAQAVLVHEVHDLWPLTLIEVSGLSPRHPFVWLCQKAEDAACRDANLVVSMLPVVKEHLAAHGLQTRKLQIVPNGIVPEDWEGEPEPLREDVAAALSAARAAGETVIGYAGSMGVPNALDTLLDAAALLRDSQMRILLVGDGHERGRLVRRIADEGLTHVTWLPPIPKPQVRNLLQGIDIAYIGWQPSPIYRFGIAPNKLMDYMMAERPVLHAVKAGNDPVAESGCGRTVPPGDPAAVATGLRELAAMDRDALRAMGERGRAHVLAHHSYPVLAQQFIEACARARLHGVLRAPVMSAVR